MATTPVTATPLPLASPLTPPGINEAIESVAANTTYTINVDNQLVVVGSNTPLTTDKDKIWLKTDSCGIPLAFYRWNPCSGLWRRVIVGLPGEIRMFCGDPTGYFDTTGLGLTTTEWDGWALCNGNNGTPDLRDKFIVSGQAFNGGFVAFFDAHNIGVTSGGSSTLKIQLYNIPSVTANLPFSGGFESGSNYTYPLGGGGSGGYTYTMPAQGTGPQTPLTIIPPFVAQGYVMFVTGPCGGVVWP